MFTEDLRRTMRRAWLMFHVSVVMVLFWGSTMESSMMYAELAMCFGRYRSIQRGARLVLVKRRLEIRQLAGVTSLKIMSSVKTWLLWGIKRRRCSGQINTRGVNKLGQRKWKKNTERNVNSYRQQDMYVLYIEVVQLLSNSGYLHVQIIAQ